MANNYTSTIRYRDPASISHHAYRDPPVYHSTSSYNRAHRDRPIHIIDSSSISDISTASTITARGDRLSDDLLNNPVTRRVLPAFLSRSNDTDGRPLKLVMNYGNLYLDDRDDASAGYGASSSTRHRHSNSKSPNTFIYNAPGSTMAISSSSGTGTGGLLRPLSPLVRTVSPSDGFSTGSPERHRLPYRDAHFGRAGAGYSRSRSHSQDRYGAGREQRRITYYEPSPPSPTYSSLSTITSSSTMSASPPGRRMSGANGPVYSVDDSRVIDRRPMAMCLGCFKTMRVCSSGYCAACDFFPGPSSGSRGGARDDVYEREIVIERERDRTPTRTTRRITYTGGGGGGGGREYRGSSHTYTTGGVDDDLATRRIRGVERKGHGLDKRFAGLSVDGQGRKPRSGEREVEFDIEIEKGRDRNRDAAVRELEKDRFRAKERAWERVERGNRGLGGGMKKKGGGAGYGAGGIRARNGDGKGNGWDYSSDSDF